ncbi:MAG: acetoacetate--CoA ligase [Gammaproteobacteria bacterium]|nr:acetoacetate--CoA ligase [Gammaproteobacteria bacterium]MBT8109727.1 acetoacetate--CoA ligase [Gammaproteobacteria bacterium]NNL44428.1 acetoacetate--CoA ligase [Woeseiaceae bacterium]
MTSNPIIWSPDSVRVQQSAMYRFMRQAGFDNYESLYQWSVDHSPLFWEAVCDFCDIHFDKMADATLRRPDNIMNAGWFDGSQLNYAANLLRNHGDTTAIAFFGENGARRELSHRELCAEVATTAAGLRASGVGKGDRVAGLLPNCPETVIAMLATTSIGAIWSSCSPDFGVNGVVDRFGQIQPKVLFAANGYIYNGKTFDMRSIVEGVAKKIPDIERVVIVPFIDELPTDISAGSAVSWSEFAVAATSIAFTAVEFDHPLYIMFSSGTTGVPKCIVHGHGGTLLQHMKEHVLHTDIHAGDRLFYFTTCGWMMWNWLVSGLAAGATLVLFDGSPFWKDGRILWEMAALENVTIFGTGAKYISALQNAGVRPGDEFQLPELRTVLSTGSPLAPESFDFVYDAIGDDLQLASISGGTDILSCFALGNPVLPVRRGELQCRGLGMAVQIFNEDGKPVVGEHGELVCTKPFPSAPVGFWNDDDGSRYSAAYFERFPGVWAHGDFAELTDKGGIIIYGRSDAVLNPGGVRIGTAEIYRQVEKLDDVVESIAIGQRWKDDVRVVLFVILRDGVDLDAELQQRIRAIIRQNTTPRHVPAKIIAVPEIPRTKSGKIVELAVRSVVHGESVKNTEALANPDALAHFAGVAELSED